VRLGGAGLDGASVPPIPVLTEAAIGRVVRTALASFRPGAELVTYALPEAGAGKWPERIDALARLRSVITPGLSLLPESRLTLQSATGQPLPGIRAVTFYDADKGLATGAWYADPVGTEGATLPAEGEAVVQARRPGPPLLFDPATGETSTPSFHATAAGAAGPVPVGVWPHFLILRENAVNALPEEAAAPDRARRGGREELAVTAERLPTAEEIITAHQAVAARQAGILKNYQARGRVDFHFRLGTSSQTLDVAMAGRFFWDTATGPEWEFTDYFVNGNRSPWKRFPELPLVQPEKVATLPLDISLDRSYAYELTGEDVVDGRPCWVLSFEPLDPEKTLYRGKVWIDKETFQRPRASVVQTKLESPFISSEERDTYGPVETPAGTLWLLRRVDGQQIYTTAGRNFIVLREVTFDDFVPNGTEFERNRQQAYASENRMLRETDKGFRALDRTEQGERVVRAGTDPSQLFGLGGLAWDQSRDFPLPLLGVDYFDFHLFGSSAQTNIFFAGVITSANVTWPGVGGTKWELGGDVFALAVNGTDRQFENGVENEKRDVDTKDQSVSLNVGRPFGSFVKARAALGVRHVGYSRSEKTVRDFTVPDDTWERTAELDLSFDRAGWSLAGSVEGVSRANWRPWGCAAGLRCGSVDPLPDWTAEAKDFTRWNASAGKEWYLPYFQKIRAGVEGFGGRDLDRFSKHSFGLFGTRLAGYAGSGVRFDTGAIARVGWAFNLGGVVRFEAGVDQGRVKDRDRPEGWQNHTGLGLSASFLGPWETIHMFDGGYAIHSDLPDVQGGGELLFVVLKLFEGKRRVAPAAGTEPAKPSGPATLP
jgi:hypothetical protein